MAKIREIRSPKRIRFPFLAIPRAHLPALMSTCTATEIRCYLLIAKMTFGMIDPATNQTAKEARISMEEFATYCNAGEKTAQLSLRMLRKRGLVQIDGPERQARIYSIALPSDLENEVRELRPWPRKRGHVTLKTRSAS